MTQFSFRSVFSRARWILLATVVVGGAWAVRYWAGLEGAAARPAAQPANRPAAQSTSAPPAAPESQPIVALVNGQTIMRDELAKECLRLHGEDVLESVVNRRLIDMHCRTHGITVTQREIDDEIDRIARKFKLPKDQYLKMLEKERDIDPKNYGKDIVWPTLALRKLAAPKLTVSRKELEEAYESQFGTAVKARLIVVHDRAKAESVLREAHAKPDEFGVLARRKSEDVNSASSNGLIQPIRRYLGDPKIEEAAFRLKPGQISNIIEVGNQFAILKCEEIIPPVKVDREQFDPVLTEAIKERKLRSAAAETFNELQKNAKVKNIINDPVLSRQYPDVAATVNGEPIRRSELAEYCVDRFGKEVLEGMINRKLIEQALSRRKQNVTDADVTKEMERAAVSMGKVLPNNKPDIEGWLAEVMQTQDISKETYIHDVVWPSAAMKKIAGSGIKVTEEDIQRGFEANYGPRVRCRAIVLDDHRRAQQVWDMARQDPTVKKFGDLAEQYSIEANSRSLRGEVPPIQKFGGQPLLEKEAFSLKPGEISGLIQVGPNFVILYCEGYTEPVNASLAEVKDLLYADILEKKQRLAMAEAFDKMKEEATIDNYLAGTSQSPKEEKELLAEDPLQERKTPAVRRAARTVQSGVKR